MKSFLVFVAVCCLLAVSRAASLAAEIGTEDSWTNLTADVPRSALFDRLKQDRSEADPDNQFQPFPFKGYFIFPKDARYDDIAHEVRKNEIFGIDLSHYSNAKIDLSLLRQQQIDFVYVKATQGIRFKDGSFQNFWPALAKLDPGRRVMRGAYHFLSAGIDGKAQADRFVDYVTLHGGFKADDLPPCVDLEPDLTSDHKDAWASMKPDEILDEVQVWLDEVESRTHRRPMIYTLESWWLDMTKGDPTGRSHFSRLAKYQIWAADYSRSDRAAETPRVPLQQPWKVWQFTATSKLSSGYPGKCDAGCLDASVYKGTMDQFLADFGMPPRAQ